MCNDENGVLRDKVVVSLQPEAILIKETFLTPRGRILVGFRDECPKQPTTELPVFGTATRSIHVHNKPTLGVPTSSNMTTRNST